MLRVLDALAHEKSYTKVAEGLGLTQSGVSHAMRAWEELLGGPLVWRSGREAGMTALGERAQIEVRAALDHLEALSALSVEPEISGHVTIASVTSAAVGILPKVLAKLQKRYPKITVELIEGSDEECATLLDNKVVDIAISMGRLGADATLLRHLELGVVCPKNHSLSKQSSIDVLDLENHPLLMSASGCEEAINDYADQADVKLNVFLKIRDTRALLEAVKSELGMTILPKLTVSELGDGLVYKDLKSPLIRELQICSVPSPSLATRTLYAEIMA